MRQGDVALKRMAAGEIGDSFVLLYRRYGRIVYALGIRLFADPRRAEALVRETFVRVWRSAELHDPDRSSAREFVLTVARRAATDAGAAAGDVDHALTSVRLRDAILGLSADHRQVLELSRDHTPPEIAQRLDIPLETVKDRTFRAMQELRVAWQERDLLV